MMRYRAEEQERLFFKFYRISKEISQEIIYCKDASIHQRVWIHVVKSGFLKLSIAKRYGGVGCNWHECMIAFEGMASNLAPRELISTLITQLRSIYLISNYGTTAEKKLYLPSLCEGELIDLNFLGKNKTVVSNVINFERSLYAIAAVGYAFALLEKHNEDLSNEAISLDLIKQLNTCNEAIHISFFE